MPLVPTPIGAGPQFHPRPASLTPCVHAQASGRVHVELFARGRVVIVPARIGVGHGCHARLWTTEPTGVVHVAGRATLGDLFTVWGEPFGPDRLLGFRGAVRLYRDGRRLRGDLRRVVLRDRDELVLELGRFIPPHRSYRFPVH